MLAGGGWRGKPRWHEALIDHFTDHAGVFGDVGDSLEGKGRDAGRVVAFGAILGEDSGDGVVVGDVAGFGVGDVGEVDDAAGGFGGGRCRGAADNGGVESGGEKLFARGVEGEAEAVLVVHSAAVLEGAAGVEDKAVGLGEYAEGFHGGAAGGIADDGAGEVEVAGGGEEVGVGIGLGGGEKEECDAALGVVFFQSGKSGEVALADRAGGAHTGDDEGFFSGEPGEADFASIKGGKGGVRNPRADSMVGGAQLHDALPGRDFVAGFCGRRRAVAEDGGKALGEGAAEDGMVVPAFGEFGGGYAAVAVGIEACDPSGTLDFLGDNLSVAVTVEEFERAGGRGVLGGV